MGLPNKLVYAIRAASARRQMRCRVNDNTRYTATQRPFASPEGEHSTAAKKENIL
jgi:hypothetical protein